MAAGTTIERAPTINLWRDLWHHVEELRAQNALLRRRLGIREVRFDVNTPLPPLLPRAGRVISVVTGVKERTGTIRIVPPLNELCPECGSAVPTSRGRPRMFCSRKCMKRAANRRQRERASGG